MQNQTMQDITDAELRNQFDRTGLAGLMTFERAIQSGADPDQPDRRTSGAVRGDPVPANTGGRMITTIIKCNQGQQRGRLRGYTITQINNGVRISIDVIALNGRAAIDAICAIADKTTRVAA